MAKTKLTKASQVMLCVVVDMRKYSWVSPAMKGTLTFSFEMMFPRGNVYIVNKK